MTTLFGRQIKLQNQKLLTNWWSGQWDERFGFGLLRPGFFTTVMGSQYLGPEDNKKVCGLVDR